MGGGWAKWQCQWPFQPGAMQLAGCGIAGLSSASAQVEEWKKEKSDEENPASVEELRKDLEKHLEEEKITSNAIPESKKVPRAGELVRKEAAQFFWSVAQPV